MRHIFAIRGNGILMKWIVGVVCALTIMVSASAQTKSGRPKPKRVNSQFSIKVEGYDAFVNKVIATRDGGALLLGYIQKEGSKQEAIAIKTLGNGRVLWTKRINTGGNAQLWDAGLTREGYLLCGFTQTGNNSDALLVLLDFRGNPRWVKTIGSSADEKIFDMFITRTLDFILLGMTSSGIGKGDVLAIKINSKGELQWAKAFGSTELDIAYSGVQLPDRGLLFTGYTRSFTENGNWDIMLLKTDQNGLIEWVQTFGTDKNETARSLVLSKDGEIIISGFTLGGGHGFWDGFLAVTDLNGNIKWSKSFGTSGDDRFYDVTLTPSGEIALAGQISGLSAVGSASLILTDRKGNLKWANVYAGNSFLGVGTYKDSAITGSGDVYSTGQTYMIWARVPYKKKLKCQNDSIQPASKDIHFNSLLGLFEATPINMTERTLPVQPEDLTVKIEDLCAEKPKPKTGKKTTKGTASSGQKTKSKATSPQKTPNKATSPAKK